MDLPAIQKWLGEHELDGWLMADFHGRNDVMMNMLEMNEHLTRRSFYFIPTEGKPTALVNAIEKAKFTNVSGEVIPYSGYKALEKHLREILQGKSRIAMEYSPNGRLPYIALVDAGTIEFVRQLGPEIVSSADLVAAFQARLTTEQIATHRMAARNLIEIKAKAHDYIAKSLTDGHTITEFDVCEFIRGKFDEYDMQTRFGPICGVDAHAGDPHYEPTRDNSAEIKKGQLVLIDLWAKIKQPNAAYGDITWMAYSGARDEIPARYVEMFEVLANARDAAVKFLRDNIDSKPVYGYEVDDVCRKVVIDAGYAQHFTHRTGHSITATEHGPGPNIDNLETEDKRRLQQGHLFSIEPGIYLDDCGFRTEIDVLISHEGAEVTTLPLQKEIVALF